MTIVPITIVNLYTVSITVTFTVYAQLSQGNQYLRYTCTTSQRSEANYSTESTPRKLAKRVYYEVEVPFKLPEQSLSQTSDFSYTHPNHARAIRILIKTNFNYKRREFRTESTESK